jgi:glycogen synthase
MHERHPGRFATCSFDYEKQPLVNAGCDFALMPSTYEPFGLAQLQAMKLGCIPLAHAVDGLRTTLSDPEKNSVRSGPPEEAWAYGQTAVLMDRFEVADYIDTARRLTDLENCFGRVLEDAERGELLASRPRLGAAWERAHQSFAVALARSLRLSRDRDAYAEVACNAMRYVTERHSWRSIAALYDEPIEHGVRQSALAAHSA